VCLYEASSDSVVAFVAAESAGHDRPKETGLSPVKIFAHHF